MKVYKNIAIENIKNKIAKIKFFYFEILENY